MSCKILVPLDGSIAAEAAILEAERLAGKDGSEIHFLHVLPSLPVAPGAASDGMLESHDQALSYLEDLRRRFPRVVGPDHIRTGDGAEAILQVALELEIDLLAMSTHARKGLARWLLGSTAETVVRRAQLPVLLIRPGLPAPPPVLRRILVPLDGSEESFAILVEVKRLAIRTGAEIVLLHVTERALVAPAPGGLRATPGIPQDTEGKMLGVAEKLGESELIYWQVIAEGDPAEEILSNAKNLEADVIAMSTHARTGRELSMLGSVAQEVLGRAGGAVLLQGPMTRGSDRVLWRER